LTIPNPALDLLSNAGAKNGACRKQPLAGKTEQFHTIGLQIYSIAPSNQALQSPHRKEVIGRSDYAQLEDGERPLSLLEWIKPHHSNPVFQVVSTSFG